MALLLIPLYYYVLWFQAYTTTGDKTVYDTTTGDQLAQAVNLFTTFSGGLVEGPPIEVFKYIPIAIIVRVLIRMGWIAIIADLVGLYTLYDTYNFVNQLKEAIAKENSIVKPGIGFIATAILLIIILIVIIDKEEIL